MHEEHKPFEEWAIVELMGHRQIAGRVSETTLAGAPMLRIDIPVDPDPGEVGEKFFSQFYGPQAIYCLTVTTDDVARRVAQNNNFGRCSHLTYNCRRRKMMKITRNT